MLGITFALSVSKLAFLSYEESCYRFRLYFEDDVLRTLHCSGRVERMKAERSLSSWRASAIDWIHNALEQIPETPESNWHVGQPTYDARIAALQLLREEIPDDLIPIAINVTRDRGIQLEWQNGDKELDLEILPDGTIEASRWKGDDLEEELALQKSYWRLRPLFEWLAVSK
jgi:hypothetical protein